MTYDAGKLASQLKKILTDPIELPVFSYNERTGNVDCAIGTTTLDEAGGAYIRTFAGHDTLTEINKPETSPCIKNTTKNIRLMVAEGMKHAVSAFKAGHPDIDIGGIEKKLLHPRGTQESIREKLETIPDEVAKPLYSALALRPYCKDDATSYANIVPRLKMQLCTAVKVLSVPTPEALRSEALQCIYTAPEMLETQIASLKTILAFINDYPEALNDPEARALNDETRKGLTMAMTTMTHMQQQIKELQSEILADIPRVPPQSNTGILSLVP